MVWALDDVAFMLVEATVLKQNYKLILKFCFIPNSNPINSTTFGTEIIKILQNSQKNFLFLFYPL